MTLYFPLSYLPLLARRLKNKGSESEIEPMANSLNTNTPKSSIYCFSAIYNCTPETLSTTVTLRRAFLQNEESPSLLGFRGEDCSEGGN